MNTTAPAAGTTTLYSATACNDAMSLREAAIVQEAKKILSRHLQHVSTVRDSGTYCTTVQATRDYLALHLAQCQREEFHVLYLNTQHALVMHEVHSTGTVDSASVYPRDIARQALLQNAKAVILAHNHPSGSLEPSHADRRITDKIKECLGMLDVRVLDHIIVSGAGESVSFADKGMM